MKRKKRIWNNEFPPEGESPPGWAVLQLQSSINLSTSFKLYKNNGWFFPILTQQHLQTRFPAYSARIDPSLSFIPPHTAHAHLGHWIPSHYRVAEGSRRPLLGPSITAHSPPPPAGLQSHRFRGGGGRRHLEYQGFRERSFRDSEARRRRPAQCGGRSLAHRSFQPHQPHDFVPRPKCCYSWNYCELPFLLLIYLISFSLWKNCKLGWGKNCKLGWGWT